MTKISNFPHKDVLCLISLTTEIRQKMIKNDYNPDDAKKKLKGIGVDVCDLTIQNLSKINQYRLVIIICHHIQSQDIDALVLSDNTLLPVDVFVNAISKEFTGLLDLAICQSKEMAYAIKALSKFSDSIRIQYVEDETDVEFRLCYIYPDLLKYFSFDPIENYRERYRNDFLGAIEAAEREQKEKVKDPNSLPEGTKLGTMATGERPSEVERNSEFSINVIFHDESSEITIEKNIKNSYNISYQFKDSKIEELNDGDSIIFDLRFDIPYPEMTNFLKGGGEHLHTFRRGAKSIISYDCKVEAGFRLNSFKGILTIRINDESDFVDIWNFRIGVTPHIDEPVKALNKVPRQVNIIGKQVSFTGIPICTDVLNKPNYFVPTIQLQALLKEDWFKEFRTSETYNEKWTDDFINALMTSQWKDNIAKDWAVTGREKKSQIKGYIVGLLKDAGVLKVRSYDSLAKRIGFRRYDHKKKEEVIMNYRTVSRYMFDGHNQPYADWVTSYVTGLNKE